MEMAKVTSKGQITIPVSIRRRLKINEGDKLLFIDRPDGVVMVNPALLDSAQNAEESGNTKQNEPKAAIKKESAQPERTEQPEQAPVSIQAEKQENTPTKPQPSKEKAKAETTVSGFNLDTLLDEIRSIGSIKN